MKLTLLFLSISCFLSIGYSQNTRSDITGMGMVEIKLKDSSGVFVMMWDDFTFKYSENQYEIIIVEGYSNKKQVIKARNVDMVSFIMDGTKVDFHRYKSHRGSNFLLLNEVYRNGDYVILQSPTFVDPIFHYIGFLGEVFSVLPNNNLDFLEFFNCLDLYNKYVDQGNTVLTLPEIKERMDFYINKCISEKVIPEEQKSSDKPVTKKSKK